MAEEVLVRLGSVRAGESDSATSIDWEFCLEEASFMVEAIGEVVDEAPGLGVGSELSGLGEGSGALAIEMEYCSDQVGPDPVAL